MRKPKLYKKAILTAIGTIAIVTGCKKSGSTSAPTKNHTVSSTLTIDDTAVANISHNSFNNNGKYAIIAYGAGGNPEVQITFWDGQSPGSGQFLITSGTVSFGKCSFAFSNSSGTSTASMGVVNLSYSSGTTYLASFSNINVAGGAGSHKVSGSFTY
jgi:hypothetical protein